MTKIGEDFVANDFYDMQYDTKYFDVQSTMPEVLGLFDKALDRSKDRGTRRGAAYAAELAIAEDSRPPSQPNDRISASARPPGIANLTKKSGIRRHATCALGPATRDMTAIILIRLQLTQIGNHSRIACATSRGACKTSHRWLPSTREPVARKTPSQGWWRRYGMKIG